MTSETRLVHEIKLECGKRNWFCYHINQGTFYTKYGGIITLDTPVGFPDLLILTDTGKTIFIETKIHPRRPTPQQIKFQNVLKEKKFSVATIYSLDEFINFVNSVIF